MHPQSKGEYTIHSIRDIFKMAMPYFRRQSRTTFTYSRKETSNKTNVPEPSKWREKKVIFIHKTIFLEACDKDGYIATIERLPFLAHSFLMHFP